MDQADHPRLDYIDSSWLKHFADKYEPRLMRKLRDIESGMFEHRQTQYALLYRDLVSLALIEYAAGNELAKVRTHLRKALQSYLEVLRLRGSEPSGRIDVSSPDDLRRSLDKGEAITQERLESSGESDYSLGNSSTSLQAMYLALSGGEFKIAESIAEHVWDPVDADYIGMDSEVCTPNEQRLAYALRECFGGNVQAARGELTSVVDPIRTIKDQTRMLTALVDNNTPAFLNTLEELVNWHSQEATEDENHTAADYFICIPGLGLSAYGWRNGAITLDSLPQCNVYLPIRLFITS